MKATGIVRRIDYSVIIGAKVKSLENTGFSLIFVQFHQYLKAVMRLPSQQLKAEKGGAAINRINAKGVH